jgi:hypothetical protein
MPPPAVRSNPPCATAATMPSPRMGLREICGKNATGATPVPRKLWLISGRELRRLGAKGGRRAVSVRVHFGLHRAYPLEKNGAVQVQGLGLELHGPAKPANRNEGSFPIL